MTKKAEETRPCKNCGAEIPITDALCRYCRSPLRQDRELTDTEKERLGSIARAMEEVLREAENSSWILGLSFLVLGAAALASYFLYARMVDSTVLPVVFSVVTAFIFFVVFGVVVGKVNGKTLDRKYDADVRERIAGYLHGAHLTRYEFDFIAASVLDKKALLRRYLYRG